MNNGRPTLSYAAFDAMASAACLNPIPALLRTVFEATEFGLPTA